ncbi:MAG TPA: hypothetical protein VH228_11270 [Nocardioides sp.]|nr:hypothetical protein [Nocardioides sp.]
MVPDDESPAEKILTEILGPPPTTSTWHRLRAQVLESAAVAEHEIDEILAAASARTMGLGDALAADVLWRLQTSVRLKLLEELLSRHGLDDEFPFVMPVVRRLFQFRHRLAHGFAQPVFLERKPLTLTVRTVTRGQVVSHSYRVEEVAWLMRQAEVVRRELVQVWAAIVPNDPAWHEA